MLNFLNKYHDLYNYWIDVLVKNTNRDKIILQQINFLRDLMNGFSVYPNIEKTKKGVNYKAEDLYLKLLGNPNKTVDDVSFLKTFTNEDKKEIYLKAKILFELREKILEKLVNKGIIKSDSDQSGIDDYEESIPERTKLRKQRFNEIANEEQDINNDLFKEYFKYQSPMKMYNTLSDTKNTERHNI